MFELPEAPEAPPPPPRASITQKTIPVEGVYVPLDVKTCLLIEPMTPRFARDVALLATSDRLFAVDRNPDPLMRYRASPVAKLILSFSFSEINGAPPTCAMLPETIVVWPFATVTTHRPVYPASGAGVV
jgi:hypothetical protein